MWVVEAVAAVLLADFLSGLAHWLEDSYFTPDTPLLGATIAKNVLHHDDPDVFTRNPWHVTIRSSVICSLVLGACLASAGLLGRVWVAALCLAAFANQVHKWSHLRGQAVPRVVRWLQQLGVLASTAQHARHHRADKDTRYCVMTNAVNPVLDALRFWAALELLVGSVTGARPRTALAPRVA